MRVSMSLIDENTFNARHIYKQFRIMTTPASIAAHGQETLGSATPGWPDAALVQRAPSTDDETAQRQFSDAEVAQATEETPAGKAVCDGK